MEVSKDRVMVAINKAMKEINIPSLLERMARPNSEGNIIQNEVSIAFFNSVTFIEIMQYILFYDNQGTPVTINQINSYIDNRRLTFNVNSLFEKGINNPFVKLKGGFLLEVSEAGLSAIMTTLISLSLIDGRLANIHPFLDEIKAASMQ